MQTLAPKTVIKLGVITFIMILAIATLLIWKSSLLLQAYGYELIGQFDNVSGLLPGAEIRYRGLRVGKVDRIIPSPEFIKVYFWVNSNVKITKGSKLKVVFDGLVGEKYISIIPNTKEKTLIKSGTILYGYSSSGLADFVEIGTQNLEQSKLILEAIRSVIANEEVKTSMRNTVIGVGTLVQGLNQLVSELKQVSSGEEVQHIIANLESVSQSFRTVTDSIIKDGNFSNSVSQISQNLVIMTTNLKDISSKLDQTIGDPKMLSQVQSSVANIESITQELKGILKDSEIKASLKSSLDNTSAVLKSSGNLMKTVSSIQSSYQANLDYNITQKRISYGLDGELSLDHKFLKVGISDRYSWPNIFNAQIGTFLTPSFSSRIGFFYTYPGAGIDWLVTDRLFVMSDVYDFNQVKWNIYGKYILSKGIGVYAGVNHLFNNDKSYSVGISYSPEPATPTKNSQ